MKLWETFWNKLHPPSVPGVIIVASQVEELGNWVGQKEELVEAAAGEVSVRRAQRSVVGFEVKGAVSHRMLASRSWGMPDFQHWENGDFIANN